jgi:hypothetical protein
MQSELDNSRYPIPNDEQLYKHRADEIYISQSPLIQTNPVLSAKCILKTASSVVHLEKISVVTTATSILRRNGKMFLKKDSNSNMVPLEHIWTEYNGKTLTLHQYPYGPVTRFSVRCERRVTFDI